MRLLKFKCSGQKLTRDSACDFSQIVSGSKGYLRVSFSFDSEWAGFVKVAEFRSRGNSEVYPVLIEGDGCVVPDDVTDSKCIYVRVVGKKSETKLRTNESSIRQVT